MKDLELITRKQAARMLSLKEGTLANWASTKVQNLPYVKIGGRIKYRVADIEKWIESRVVNRMPETK